MKKMKKFFAVILSLAMVLGMSITAFATEAGTATQAATGKITVEGLTKEKTTVKIYKVVSWDEAKSEWKVENWAKDQVDLTKNPVTINWNALKNIATDADLYQAAKEVSDGTAEFDNLEIGAYLITANGITIISVRTTVWAVWAITATPTLFMRCRSPATCFSMRSAGCWASTR